MDFIQKFLQDGQVPTITVAIEKQSIINLCIGIVLAFIIIILISRISK